MKVLHHVIVLSLLGLWVPPIILGCASMPVVQQTCVIAWDRSEDSRIDEYRVTVWMVSEGKSSEKVTHRVKASATQVSCEEVGTHATGKWQATIQACLKDGVCSDSSQPISFEVVNK
jgi:hypothetical protein